MLMCKDFLLATKSEIWDHVKSWVMCPSCRLIVIPELELHKKTSAPLSGVCIMDKRFVKDNLATQSGYEHDCCNQSTRPKVFVFVMKKKTFGPDHIWIKCIGLSIICCQKISLNVCLRYIRGNLDHSSILSTVVPVYSRCLGKYLTGIQWYRLIDEDFTL